MNLSTALKGLSFSKCKNLECGWITIQSIILLSIELRMIWLLLMYAFRVNNYNHLTENKSSLSTKTLLSKLIRGHANTSNYPLSAVPSNDKRI